MAIPNPITNAGLRHALTSQLRESILQHRRLQCSRPSAEIQVIATPMMLRAPAHRAAIPYDTSLPPLASVVHSIDSSIDAGDREDAVAEQRHQRFQVPVPILESVARSLCDELDDDQRDDGRHDVDEAVHAIEDDGLRARGESAADADHAEDDRQDDRKLECGLLGVWLLGLHCASLRGVGTCSEHLLSGATA